MRSKVLHIKNIVKGWFTSLFIGLPLFVASFVLPLQYKELNLSYDPEWYVRTGMVILGMVALLLSDDFKGILKDVIHRLKNKYLILVPLLFLSLLSCNRKLATSVETKEVIKYKDTTIYIPGERVASVVNYDSIVSVLNKMKSEGKNPEIVHESSNSKAVLTYRIDKDGKLYADCSSEDAAVSFLLKEITRLRNTTKVIEVFKTPWPTWMLLGAISAILVISLIINILFYLKTAIKPW